MAAETNLSVKVIGVPVIAATTDFNSELEKANRKRVVEDYARLSNVEISLSGLAMISGVTSFGLGIANASWPFLNCFPYISGITMMMAGWLTRITGHTIPDSNLAASVRTKVLGHFILIWNCLAASALAIGFSVHGLVFCLSPFEELRARCTPNHDLMTAFIAVNVFLQGLLLSVCLAGLVLFYAHARTLDLMDPMSRMQEEVEVLRLKVDDLQRGREVVVEARAGQGVVQAAGSGEAFPIPLMHLPPPSYPARGYTGARV